MRYAFYDRVEVHEATGGRTIYRQQNNDIHINFIGSYNPPDEPVSEEERIAAIDAEQKRKKQEKGRRAKERRKQKIEALRLAAEAGDPEAIAQYEQHLSKLRERNQKYRQKVREAREADPEYLRQLAEKRKYQSEATTKSRQKMKAAAEAGDPDGIRR